MSLHDWWGNLENMPWYSMELLTKVGHAKVLETGKSLTPPLGTISANHRRCAG